MGQLAYLLALMVRLIPKPLCPAVARAVYYLGYPFAGPERQKLQTNVAQIYGLPAHSSFSKMFCRQVFQHQITSAIESIKTSYDPSGTRIDGLDELRKACLEALSHGKGMLIVTAHLGSWELVGWSVRHAIERPFFVLAKPSKYSGVTKLLERLRERMGMEVYWTGSKSLLRDMVGTLDRGDALGFVMDQKPKGRQGPIVDFFGRPTEFVGGPAALTCKLGTPVVQVYCLRQGPFHYRLRCHELFAAGHDCKDRDQVTQKMALGIESMVRLYPEQWSWNYKRWRFGSAVPKA